MGRVTKFTKQAEEMARNPPPPKTKGPGRPPKNANANANANSNVNGERTPQRHSVGGSYQLPQTHGSGTPGKPVVEVRIWIVKTRTPLFQQELWKGGKFGTTPLGVVFDIVSKSTRRNDIEDLKFMLQTCEKQCMDTVRKDDVPRFEYVKRIFDEEIKRAFAKDRNQLRAFEIFIEPGDNENDAEDGQSEVEDAVLQEWP